MAGAIRISQLHRYPLKSARGEALAQAQLASTGLAGDREWLLVGPGGRFLTQREHPRLARLGTRLDADALHLEAPGLQPLALPARPAGSPCMVTIWKDSCAALDQGDAAAAALSRWLGAECRLVRFDPAHRRLSDAAWTGSLEAANAFSDGFPLLLVNEASLADLNQRMGIELPIDRFRPNLVVQGLPAWGEDALGELQCGEVVLRRVKPCTRCRIPTIDQASGEPAGDEPLRTLSRFRFDARVGGLTFGQNLVIVRGAGETLSVGDLLQPS